MSHATLLSDLMNYLEKEIDRIVVISENKHRANISVPVSSNTPLIRSQVERKVSTKAKILKSIKEYSQMLMEEKDSEMRGEIFKTL